MKKYFIFYIFLFILTSTINSLDNNPFWISLKRAENYKEKGEFALAVLEAKRARKIFIEKKLSEYYEEIRAIYKHRIEYELTKMVKDKKAELLANDNFPVYHELIGDLYVLTDFVDEALKEYKRALAQKEYFDYFQKEIEIKYKIAKIYNMKMNYELEDILYREILEYFFNQKNIEYWDRIKYHLKRDITLNHIFRIYKIEGMEYLEALYKVGRRAAILQKKEEALFFLSTAVIVWMNFYSELIKKYHVDFEYSHPTDFINFFSKKIFYEYGLSENLINEILFYIGYTFHIIKETDLKDYYFNLSIKFSRNTLREEEILNRIEYLNKDSKHLISYDELF